jgi:hypothetical protein
MQSHMAFHREDVSVKYAISNNINRKVEQLKKSSVIHGVSIGKHEILQCKTI